MFNGFVHKEIENIFRTYGLTAEESAPVVQALQRNPNAWIDFMMRFELGLEEPDPKRALTSAATIAGSYIAGGFIPLAPYILIHHAPTALLWSAGVTLVALIVFGYVKGKVSGTSPGRSALQTALIGGLAATAAFLIARMIS